MASLVLGAAGALVGSFFGPFGASIGWALGSALGGALFPGKGQNGPRLTDLKLQVSSYGQMIPIVYGTVRIAGNVIWKTDLVEHAQKSGGKGGPTVTNYTYSASFAVLLCEGPILDVKRIWADSRLVYDESVTPPGDFPFALYLGDESQLPDPTMEAVEGVGNVPGYRGEAYIVFDDIFLTDYGNRIPSLTFEVTTTSIPNGHIRIVKENHSEPVTWWYSSAPVPSALAHPALTLWPDATTNIRVRSITLPNVDAFDQDLNYVSSDAGTTADDWPFEVYTSHLNPTHTGYNFAEYEPLGMYNGAPVWISCTHSFNGIATFFPTAAGTDNPALPMSSVGFSPDGGHIICPFNLGSLLPVGEFPAAGCTTPDGSSLFIFTSPTYALAPSSVAIVDKWYQISGNALVAQGTVSPALSARALGFGNASVNSSWVQQSALTAEANGKWFWQAGSQAVPGSSSVMVYEIDNAGNFAFNAVCGVLATGDTKGDLSPTVLSPAEGYCGFAGATSLVLFTRLPLNPSLGVPLGDIVADLSGRAGLVAEQYDVSELTDLVDGYVIATQADTRSDIEPLQIAWPFDAVEHDVVVKFVRRGVNSVATSIPVSDLGAYVFPGEPPADLETTRMQEVDLPRIVDAVYLNKETDYQEGEARSQRLITTSELTTSVHLPIVMDDTKARQITDVLLYNAWIEREQFTVQLSRKWIGLEPSDVINARNRQMRITEKTEGADGVITLKAVATNLQVYLQATVPASGVGMPGGGGTPPTSPPTKQLTDLIMLDLPLVSDGDSPNGYYAAMAGAVSTSWPGATLFKSNDGGVTYASLLLDINADAFGTASTVLGSFTGGNIFDETNSVTVVLTPGSGQLSSSSHLAVLNGANAATIGNELLQFRDAQLIAARTYQLTGLLRGRRGTEWAITSHTVNERFCLLPTSVNVNGPFPEIGAARDFKAVTSGSSLASANNVTFTNNGVALRCYSPVGIGGGLNPSGDLTITWTRRTRIGGDWSNLVDVPLSEATESYIVQVWDSTFSNCARIIGPVATPSATYTSADQVTDFGAQQQTIFVTVGQIGTIGLGIQAGAALLGAGATVDAVITPIPPYHSGPPSPPPAGGCVGTVFTDSFSYGTGVRLTSDAGFVPGTNWVISLTTPSSSPFRGRVDFYEFGGPPGTKDMRLATSACGVPLSPIADVTNDLYPSIRFAIGFSSFPTSEVVLAASTTYYFSLQTDFVGTTAAEVSFYP